MHVEEMAEHGHMLNPQQSFEKMKVRNIVADYFGDPVMAKVKATPSGSAVYAARVDVVVNEPRYVICVEPDNASAIGSITKMSNLEWSSLQTRHIDADLKCPRFVYTARGSRPFDTSLKIIDRGANVSTYVNEELGFRLGLRHTDSKSQYEYPDFGTFATGLETYEASLTI